MNEQLDAILAGEDLEEQNVNALAMIHEFLQYLFDSRVEDEELKADAESFLAELDRYAVAGGFRFRNGRVTQ